jgi:hypothetical protein
MIVPELLKQELMSNEEKAQRIAAAQRAKDQGQDWSQYWRDQPQLNTVGYMTTAVGALVAGYAVGWITGRFDPPFERLQMNLVAPFLDVTDSSDETRPECTCGRMRGMADQAAADALISVPSHWPPARRV